MHFQAGRAGRVAALATFSLLFVLATGVAHAAAGGPAAAAGGGTAAPTSTDVLVLIAPEQQSDEPFRQVIADAAQYKLERVGLAAQVASPAGEAGSGSLPTAATGAAVALVCRYQVKGQEMSVSLSWYDMRDRTMAVTVKASGEVDLHLDGVILAALDNVLDRMKDRIHALATGRAEKKASTLPPGAPQGPVPKLEPAPVRPAPGQPGGKLPAGDQAGRPGRGPLILVSGSFAPFLPTGAASYYFGLGYLPSLLASVLFPIPGGRLGVGLAAGMDYFAAAGVADTSTNYLLPVGIDLRYELEAGALRPFLHVAGGPAALVIVTGSQGTLTDLVPFLKSGIGLDVGIASWLGIFATLDYDVYFEMPYLITGFTPSLGMAMRL